MLANGENGAHAQELAELEHSLEREVVPAIAKVLPRDKIKIVRLMRVHQVCLCRRHLVCTLHFAIYCNTIITHSY